MRKFTILLWFVVSSGAVAPLEQLQFLRDFLDSVHREQSIPTLLVMQRKSTTDHLQQLYPLPWPTIRLDETQSIELVNFLSKATLALVYMDSLEDTSLLTALAANFNHIRASRTVIWLPVRACKKLLDILIHQAAEHKFLNLLIIEKAERFLRLYPFPRPSFQVARKPFEEGKIFPCLWCNFKGKKALTVPDMVPPRSFVHTDQRTGRKRYDGYLYLLMRNFAHRYNITLQQQLPPMGNETVSQWQIMESTVRGELDLPMTGQLVNFRHPELSRTDCFLGMSALSIVVPCGMEMTMGERIVLLYGLAPSYSFVAAYILLSAVEVLLRKIYNIIHKRHDIQDLLGIVLNLRMIRCLLAMSVPRGNRYRSVKAVLLMVMTFAGMIHSTITIARYNTVMAMFPQYNHILNFQQLRESNLTVVFNYVNLKRIKEEMDPEFIAKTLPNVVATSSAEQIRMLVSLNTSYAYQTYSYAEDPFSMIQKRSYRKVLCKSPELDIVSGLPYTAVLHKNSEYALALKEFVSQTWSVGLSPHWIKTSIREYFSNNRLPPEIGGNPLKLRDYKVTFCILITGYALASCAFMAEVFIAWRRSARRFNNQS